MARTRIFVTKLALLALLAVAGQGMAGGSQPSAAFLTARSTSSAPLAASVIEPVDIAIAVDESGSITQPEMVQERTAARLIGLGELAPDSKVTVFGFGGPDALDKNYQQSTVDQVCATTPVNTAANRQYLSNCIGQLHVRSQAQGWNTDFIGAINQGVGDLVGAHDTGRPRLLFLLTDGYLDLYGDPAYSGNKQQVSQAAQANLVQEALPAARQAQVEIWPLGFGAADLSELKTIAAGGAQARCANLPNARPHAIKVLSAPQAEAELPVIYAYARCVYPGPEQQGPVSPGNPLDLQVTIPVIATDGAIDVYRQNPTIHVTFIDPNHKPVPDAGSFDGSAFQLAGADGPVESLRISNPEPGTWTIRFQEQPGAPGVQVQARVLWRGHITSDVTVAPPDPVAGQRVVVSVRVQARNDQSIPPAALVGMSVGAAVTGTGLRGPVNIPLADNGQAPDNTASDGVYTGYFNVPKTASGTLLFTDAVNSQGVSGDHNSAQALIASKPPGLTMQVTLNTNVVAPGHTVTGTLLVSNKTGHAQRIALELVGTARGVTITPPLVPISAAYGERAPISFAVHFARSVRPGPSAGSINAVDQSSPGLHYETFLTVTVALPPPWWRSHWWVLAILAALLILAATVTILGIRRRIRGRDMEDIELLLYQGSTDVEVHGLQAPKGCGPKFTFTIDRSQPDRPRLELEDTGMPGYVARRRGNDGIVVATPGGERLEIPIDDKAPIDDMLQLGYRDHRLTYASYPPDTGDWADEPDTEPERRRGWMRRRRRDDVDDEAEGGAEPAQDSASVGGDAG